MGPCTIARITPLTALAGSRVEESIVGANAGTGLMYTAVLVRETTWRLGSEPDYVLDGTDLMGRNVTEYYQSFAPQAMMGKRTWYE